MKISKEKVCSAGHDEPARYVRNQSLLHDVGRQALQPKQAYAASGPELPGLFSSSAHACCNKTSGSGINLDRSNDRFELRDNTNHEEPILLVATDFYHKEHPTTCSLDREHQVRKDAGDEAHDRLSDHSLAELRRQRKNADTYARQLEERISDMRELIQAYKMNLDAKRRLSGI